MTRHKKVPPFSESALAKRFVDRHGDELRYCAAWSKWLRYDGSCWRTESTHLAYDLAHAIGREAALEFDEKVAVGLASNHTSAAVVALARADRRIAATVDQWDPNPWALATLDGIVDLRTGKMRAPDPEEYQTKSTTVMVPDNVHDCPIPTWLKFLDRIFAGDVDLIAYMQRVLGYCLTGTTDEHAMFFCYGTGANGKSVFLSTVAGILGDYQRSAPIETFTVAASERHPTELAGLRGARLVTAVETEEGRRWAESRIKALTGGDTISARFMRQDFFDFKPQFKLIIAGNHKPGLRVVDEAIRRRFNLIPFAVTIPAAERDGELTEKLKLEWPGILRWMIQGCLMWQNTGLCPPRAVADATDAYLEAEDAFSAWRKARCVLKATGTEKAATLYASWKAWCEGEGEKVGSQKRFSQMLARGFDSRRTPHGREYMGLQLALETRHDGS